MSLWAKSIPMDAPKYLRNSTMELVSTKAISRKKMQNS